MLKFLSRARCASSPSPYSPSGGDYDHSADGEALDLDIIHLRMGSRLTFFVYALLSGSFNFFGFTITYLFHTSPAAKYGSQAGLGITLLRFGLFERARSLELRHDSDNTAQNQTMSNDHRSWHSAVAKDAAFAFAAFPALANNNNQTRAAISRLPSLKDISFQGDMSIRDWISVFCLAFGMLALIRSLFLYYLVRRRHRQSWRAQPAIIAIPELSPNPPAYACSVPQRNRPPISSPPPYDLRSASICTPQNRTPYIAPVADSRPVGLQIVLPSPSLSHAAPCELEPIEWP